MIGRPEQRQVRRGGGTLKATCSCRKEAMPVGRLGYSSSVQMAFKTQYQRAIFHLKKGPQGEDVALKSELA